MINMNWCNVVSLLTACYSNVTAGGALSLETGNIFSNFVNFSGVAKGGGRQVAPLPWPAK